MNLTVRLSLIFLSLLVALPLLAEDDEVKPGIVLNSVDESLSCILPVIVTAVDGEEQKDTDMTGRYEFEPGKHTISGYGGGNPAECSTFATGAQREALNSGKIGEGTLDFNVESGKEYYIGIDVRSNKPERWKIVVWKINH
jgi:hypothetical protein